MSQEIFENKIKTVVNKYKNLDSDKDVHYFSELVTKWYFLVLSYLTLFFIPLSSFRP